MASPQKNQTSLKTNYKLKKLITEQFLSTSKFISTFKLLDSMFNSIGHVENYQDKCVALFRNFNTTILSGIDAFLKDLLDQALSNKGDVDKQKEKKVRIFNEIVGKFWLELNKDKETLDKGKIDRNFTMDLMRQFERYSELVIPYNNMDELVSQKDLKTEILQKKLKICSILRDNYRINNKDFDIEKEIDDQRKLKI